MHKVQSQVTISRLWVLPGGDFTVDYSIMVEGGASRDYTARCPAFLIQHPSALVLFDTGLSPRAIDDPTGYYGEEIALTMKLRFSHEQRVDSRLAQLGFRPTDVRHVIMSHLHIDHAGGMYLFPHATFHAFADELTEARAVRHAPHAVYKLEDLAPVENCVWKLYDSDVDIFGDGSLRFFKLPGHSAGEGSLLVRLASRNLMLTADSVHVREALEREKPTLFDSDPVAAVRSVQRLKQLIAENSAESWIAHDVEDWQRYCTFPNPLT
jgi:glyoxylase-like metal-dependent hydrolase (beta-lactamase superfamily II)